MCEKGDAKGDAKWDAKWCEKGCEKGLYIVHCKYIQTSLSSGLGCIPNTSKKKIQLFTIIYINFYSFYFGHTTVP